MLVQLVTLELSVLLEPMNVLNVLLDIIQLKEVKPASTVPLDTINHLLNVLHVLQAIIPQAM